jgi:hypothetical protein
MGITTILLRKQQLKVKESIQDKKKIHVQAFHSTISCLKVDQNFYTTCCGVFSFLDTDHRQILQTVKLANHGCLIIIFTVCIEDQCVKVGMCSKNSSMTELAIKKYSEDVSVG